jgi:hypothetical protein
MKRSKRSHSSAPASLTPEETIARTQRAYEQFSELMLALGQSPTPGWSELVHMSAGQWEQVYRLASVGLHLLRCEHGPAIEAADDLRRSMSPAKRSDRKRRAA